MKNEERNSLKFAIVLVFDFFLLFSVSQSLQANKLFYILQMV